MDGFSYHNIFDTKGIEYLIIIAFFLMIIPFWITINRETPAGSRVKSVLRTFAENVLRIPAGILFSSNHTWTYLKKSGLAEVGIDKFLVHMAGDMKLTTLKEEGTFIRKGDLLAELDHKGRKLRIYSPISGQISGINNLVSSSPMVLSDDPYEKGWLYRINPAEWATDTNDFYRSDTALAWLKLEVQRLREFLASETGMYSPELSPVMLQDGGELCDKPLTGLPDEVWNDFQKSFLDLAG
jgi:glycine cleavage system H protein